MAVREITMIGHKALHQRTKRVREVTDEIRTLVADMFDTNDAADGAGLAANQVGARWRIFVYDCEDGEGVRQRGHVINPKLERGPVRPLDEEDDWEGCLSVPGEGFPTARATWARVTGTDLDGNDVVIESDGGILARCLQHEVDHLDGSLYVDRLNPTWKAVARETVKDRGWADRGILKWDPTKKKAEKV